MSSRVAVPSSVLFRNLQGETVLLHLASGQYFSLDQVGTCIWEALRAQGTLSGALSALLAAFTVEEAQAREDVLRFVAQLESHGLVELVDSAA